jgi:ParB-like chromosome segregation protein Spo0J
MPIDTQIRYAALGELYLDAKNPRLGRQNTSKDLTQDQVLDLMKDWALDELATSFLESGFWPQEALIGIREGGRLVVVEGNRRLAALKLLDATRAGQAVSRRWTEVVESATPEQFARLEAIPYLLADSRADVDTYLGFRHVTGIKQWNPAEKAEYIAHLVDERGMSYREVMRKIGSKTPTVRQNYITYRLLLQMEEDDRIAVDRVEEKFSVLYLAMRSSGVQRFLEVNIQAEPEQARVPVPRERLENLVKFALWLFGDENREPVVTDSRQVDRFARILESPEAMEYLERAEQPNFETAYRKTGGDEKDVITLVDRAADTIEEALTSAHRHVDSAPLQRAMRRFGLDALQLIRVFPTLATELIGAN